MRAAARLHPGDAGRVQGAGAGEEFRVLARVDVVGDDGDIVPVAEMAAEPLGQGRLAGAHRAADAHPERSGAHERKSLVYCVSWRMESRSSIGAAVPRVSRSAANAASAAVSTTGCSAAVATCPSVWPSGTSRTPAETRLAAKAASQPASAGRSGAPWKAAEIGRAHV